MPASESDLRFYLSGGAANSDPLLSLGGVISSTEIIDPQAVFDRVHYAESNAGDTEYRCVYLKNDNGTFEIFDIIAWVVQAVLEGTSDPAPDEIAIAFDPAGVGNGVTTGVATTVGDEDSAPGGVTFTTPIPEAEEDAIGGYTLNAGQTIAIWIRRYVPASTSVSNRSKPKVRFTFGL